MNGARLGGSSDARVRDNRVSDSRRSNAPVLSLSSPPRNFVGAFRLQLLRYLVINLESSEGVCYSSLYRGDRTVVAEKGERWRNLETNSALRSRDVYKRQSGVQTRKGFSVRDDFTLRSDPRRWSNQSALIVRDEINLILLRRPLLIYDRLST